MNTYDSLKTVIADTLNRTDLEAAIPTFIALCETQTERQLRVRQMLASTSITIDGELEPLPADFLETRSIVLNTNPVRLLNFRTIDSMAQFKAAFSAVGRPTEFTVIGNDFQFLPVPDSAYTATLTYYQSIPRLSAMSQSNWLLAKAPDIYLYGALINSAPYLKEDGRISTWATYYQGAVDALSVEDDRAQTATSGLKAKARQF
jgi:hypothetical protein